MDIIMKTETPQHIIKIAFFLDMLMVLIHAESARFYVDNMMHVIGNHFCLIQRAGLINIEVTAKRRGIAAKYCAWNINITFAFSVLTASLQRPRCSNAHNEYNIHVPHAKLIVIRIMSTFIFFHKKSFYLKKKHKSNWHFPQSSYKK